jgi:micrococcal nuclease
MINLYTYKGKCTKVIDGDTFEAMVDLGFNTWISITIRLNGINTPESRTKDKEEKVKGLAAKLRLQQIMEFNKNEFSFISHGVEKYGRCLAEVFVNTLGEISIQKTLITEGHGKEYDGGKR